MAVLLVEDDRDIRESLVELLEAEGHLVTPLGSAREALRILDWYRSPVLVLLDLRMPGMDGLSFLAALRGRPDGHRYRVVLMSADRSVKGLRETPGVVAVLEKPFETSELLEILENHAA